MAAPNQDRLDQIGNALIGDRQGMYRNSSAFHHGINTLVPIVTAMIEILADQSAKADQEQQAAITELEGATPNVFRHCSVGFHDQCEGCGCECHQKRSPRERWGTCCPGDPNCEHSFLDYPEEALERHMDTPITDTEAEKLEADGV
ncbi:MAG: hypothetical protein GY906_10085 [bacterium]|nr:hypothetical protein [bacterium]